MTKIFTVSLLAAGVLFLETNVNAQNEQIEVQRSLTSALGGDGGRVRLATGAFADGRDPEFIIKTDAEGNKFMEAFGELHLQSDKLDLQCEHLYYSNDEGILKANDDIILNTDGVYAESGLLEYTIDNQGLRLEKNPFVRQESGGNRILFTEMDIFTVKPENQVQFIDLTGKLVKMKIEPLENSESVTKKDTGGLSAFGENIEITAKERKGQIANIKSKILPDGTTEKIEMFGSVVLLSDEFNIRGNELIYDPINQLFTAKGDVFLKQEQLTVDCGLMVYNLATNKIRFSDKPDVKYKEGPQITHMSEFEAVNFLIGEDVTDMRTESSGVTEMYRTSDIENPQ